MVMPRLPTRLRKTRGFSLTETVIALGLFAFCILGVVALIPVGMNAARSVTQESTAVNLAEAFFCAWQVAPSGAATFPIPGMFPAGQREVPLSAGSGTVFFLGDGTQASSSGEAAMQMDYNVAVAGDLATITLEFVWPVSTSTNLQQRRSFQRAMSR